MTLRTLQYSCCVLFDALVVLAVQNRMAHCRDCHQLLAEGLVRVGAHVFSSSSRHAGYSINYWCLDCMCARPGVRRMARLYPMEIAKVLPGAELLAEADLQRTCALLGMALPDPTALTALAAGRIRATRSGRKFNTWGGPSDDEVAAAGTATGLESAGSTADASLPNPQNKRARR